MLPVEWKLNALDALDAIAEYIGQRNQTAADLLVGQIENAATQLASYPYLYRHGKVAGTREMVVHPNYVVVYRVHTTTIEILNVLHTRQQYP